MATGVFQRPLRLLDRLGAQPAETPDERLQKNTLMVTILLIASLSLVWIGLYLRFDEPLAAAIPAAYVGISFINLAFYAWKGRYALMRSSQLVMTFLLPLAVMAALGTFASSSVVVLWSLTSPLGALFFLGRRQSLRWFAAYVLLVAAALLVAFFGRASNNLPPVLVNLFFAMNILGVSLVAFILIHYFVGQKDAALELLREEQAKSERLLLNVLPREIAPLLKNEVRTTAEHYDAVSVLFADVVGFTGLSAERSA
ncbi:MAG: hypothetical protein ACRDHL_15540, partial [Candidatus Promineifilaceae bacterium]